MLNEKETEPAARDTSKDAGIGLPETGLAMGAYIPSKHRLKVH
jgi:hypothetical protein